MRQLRLAGASVVIAAVAGLVSAATARADSAEAEKMTVSPPAVGQIVPDAGASGGSALMLTGNGKASATVSLPKSTGLVVRAKAPSCALGPNLTLSLDDTAITTVLVEGTSWANYTFTGMIPAGKHEVTVEFSNSVTDPRCRRALYVDSVKPMTGSFAEDFNGGFGQAPDGAVWTPKIGDGWDPGLETYNPKNAFLDGKGNLVLQADKTVKTGYISGWVESKNKVSFGYGLISARVKVPKGQGLWPAFWLKGADEDTYPWPECGEIDVFELPSTTTTVYSTLHGPIAGTEENRQAQTKTDVPDLAGDFHVFWVRHMPDVITIGVDGRTLTTFTPDTLREGSRWVYNRPMQAILDLAVGGEWVGAPDDSTKFPSAMLVDWVRWDPPDES